MAKKSKKVEERRRILKIEDVEGWILIAKEEDCADWRIAWHDPFKTKKSALLFATDNSWPQPYQAIRGRLTVT